MDSTHVWLLASAFNRTKLAKRRERGKVTKLPTLPHLAIIENGTLGLLQGILDFNGDLLRLYEKVRKLEYMNIFPNRHRYR